jgi:potassium-transporting ATPase KdpC subunit
MVRHMRAAVMMLLLMTLITGVCYPLLVTGLSQLLFPSKANGSIIEKDGRWVGSTLIGQQFTSPKYFWSRLSATTPFPYNSASSAGTNYGPLNPALLKATEKRVDLLRSAGSTNDRPVPIDLVTASGSGLDPHISLAAALFQASRVARERNMSEADLRALIRHYTKGRTFAVLGEPRVNVLELNLALDDISKGKK